MPSSFHRGFSPGLVLWVVVVAGCGSPKAYDSERVRAEVESAVWAFHSTNMARDAEAVIGMLWPDFTMLVDGNRLGYAEVAAGSRAFMASLEHFHTTWTGLNVIPLGPDVAVASFMFRDSIVTTAGAVIRSRGPTTFVWERREGEWRLRFADADHYPVDP